MSDGSYISHDEGENIKAGLSYPDAPERTPLSDETIWPVTACEDDCSSWTAEAASACDCGADEARRWIARVRRKVAALEGSLIATRAAEAALNRDFAALEQERDDKMSAAMLVHGETCPYYAEVERLRAAIKEAASWLDPNTADILRRALTKPEGAQGVVKREAGGGHYCGPACKDGCIVAPERTPLDFWTWRDGDEITFHENFVTKNGERFEVVPEGTVAALEQERAKLLYKVEVWDEESRLCEAEVERLRAAMERAIDDITDDNYGGAVAGLARALTKPEGEGGKNQTER